MAKSHQLPSGAWRALVYVGKKPDGTREYKSVTADTQKQCDFEAAKLALEYKNSDHAAKLDITVGQAIDRYIDNKSNVLSPSTIRAYKSMRKTRYPDLMGVKLSKLTPLMIQTAVNADVPGRTPKTVRNAHALLASAISEAIPDFPPLKTKLPQRVKPDIAIPDDAFIAALVARITGGHLEIPVYLAACMGLRRSEICALDWSDYDGKTLSISKALVHASDGAWITKATKTTASKRVLDVPDAVKIILNPARQLSGRIVPDSPDAVSRAFTRAKVALGRPDIRFHDLRHFYASLLHAIGVPDKYAIKRTGHVTDNMLKSVYQHTIESRERSIDDTINRAVSAVMQHEMQHASH